MIGSLMPALLIAALVASPVSLRGTFALQSGSARTNGHLNATQFGASPLRQRLDLWLTGSDGKTIRRYDVDMTKRLHLVIIGDDFQTFEHVHPTLAPDGHFSIVAAFPKAQAYHIYGDCEPTGIGQQVFRYDLAIGSGATATRDLVATGRSVLVDGYRVTLEGTRLRAGSETKVEVHVTKAGARARDLREYLGALAHAVFIDADDLSYAHVHPMALGGAKSDSMAGMDVSKPHDMADMPGMSASPIPDTVATSPDMVLHVRVLRPGTYKLWLQFRSTTGLHVAPFVLQAT